MSDQLEEIKSKLNIVDFISEYVAIKKTGRNFKGLCPFHNEKTPSFIVSPERQIFHCFGCQAGGDVFGFLMKIENIDFVEALRILAKRTGVTLKSYAPTGEESKKELLYEINHLSAEFYHYLLVSHPIAQKARTYLKERGIKEKTIEIFKIGYAPDLWQSVSKYLVGKKGYQPKDLELAGLTIKSRDYYDRFRGRLIFPLIDHRGNTVGFSGRLLDSNAKGLPAGRQEAKYVNSPETPVYQKSHHLFGINVAKDAIKRENLAILVEGEFDMISSFQAGITNVVAIKGSALTEGHVSLLKRYTENIAFALDSDFAGNTAAVRGIEIADRGGLNMRAVSLLYGKDPDECINKDPALWRKSVNDALPIYDYLLGFSESKNNPAAPEGKRQIASEILPFIAKISNEIIKSHYIKKISTLLSVSEDSIVKELSKIDRGKNKNWQADKEETNPLTRKSREELLEETLISLLLQSDKTKKDYQTVSGFIDHTDFFTPVLKKIYSVIEKFLEDKEWDLHLFFTALPKELISIADRLYLLDYDNSSLKEEEITLEIEKLSIALSECSLRRKLKEIALKIAAAEKNEDNTQLVESNKEYLLFSQKLKELQNTDYKPSKK